MICKEARLLSDAKSVSDAAFFDEFAFNHFGYTSENKEDANISPRDKVYHTFISYRVATEHALVNTLTDKTILQSAVKRITFPPYETCFNPYLDSRCLKDGED